MKNRTTLMYARESDKSSLIEMFEQYDFSWNVFGKIDSFSVLSVTYPSECMLAEFKCNASKLGINTSYYTIEE